MRLRDELDELFRAVVPLRDELLLARLLEPVFLAPLLRDVEPERLEVERAVDREVVPRFAPLPVLAEEPLDFVLRVVAVRDVVPRADVPPRAVVGFRAVLREAVPERLVVRAVAVLRAGFAAAGFRAAVVFFAAVELRVVPPVVFARAEVERLAVERVLAARVPVDFFAVLRVEPERLVVVFFLPVSLLAIEPPSVYFEISPTSSPV